jgi:dTDP-4-dehydrorhamnose reductase
VQTEDLGFCHATPPMAAQAEYENARRWITWDLLCGMVTPDHPLWSRICAWGLEDRLRAIADDPCPPDVIGVNHYLSSERLLDHRVELYPPNLAGGDGPGPYVNIEAVRTVAAGPIGLGALLTETWERYGRSIAITECHNGCTREEQVRWFDEVWRTAEAVRAEGVDILAVTAWALLGSYDWNNLLAHEAGHYETGVFDLSQGSPRPTAMVPFLKALAAGKPPVAPFLHGRGWWRREDRFFEQVIELPPQTQARPPVPLSEQRRQPVLIVGNTAARTDALVRACGHRELAVACVETGLLQESAEAVFLQAVADADPWAVIIVADEPLAERLRRAAASLRTPCILWVEEGAETWAPGRTELIVSSGPCLAEHELQLFCDEVIASLRLRRPFRAASNRMTPAIYLPDAANVVLDMMVDGVTGRASLAGPAAMSWAETAVMIANEVGLDAHLVEPSAVPRIGVAPKPAGLSEPGRLLPGIDSAVRRRIAAWKLIDSGRNGCPREDERADAFRAAAE